VDGFPTLTVTFNSQCVTDRVNLSGYRKFWLVKEKAGKKFKFPSLTSISNSNSKQKKEQNPKKRIIIIIKTISGFWLMEHLDITSGSHNLHQFKLLFRFY
jgi:hypothetical protein